MNTKYGNVKKIPKAHLWHHKSCGQCGHIPGYSTSIFWVMRKLGYDYNDPRDQTSCTAWNYYASATSNAAAQAAVALRNFAAAYEVGYFPLIHCGTSYGHYKEVREELMHHPELRAQVRDIMAKRTKLIPASERFRTSIEMGRVVEMRDDALMLLTWIIKHLINDAPVEQLHAVPHCS